MRRGVARAAGRAARGFTLLEAIVALVVFSIGALALYGWLSTNVITLERVRERQQVEAATHSALDLIRRVNPMRAPAGRRELGELSITWNATPVEPPKQGVTQTGSPSSFVVGLYLMRVQLRRDGEVIGEFSVRQAGWRQLAMPPP